MKPTLAFSIPAALACLAIAAFGQEATKTVVVAPKGTTTTTKVQQVAPADRPVNALGAARVDANINLLVPRKTGQLRAYLRTEYAFLVAVAQPTKAQRKAIATFGEGVLLTVARRDAEWQLGRRPAGSLVAPDPPALLREALAEAAKSYLDPDAAARYRGAIAARLASQRRAIRLNIVANLDRTLFLSASQREAIAAALAANWDETWDCSIQFLINDGPYTVAIPDRAIVPHLTEAQKVTWFNIQKVAAPTWAAARANTNQAVDDVPLEDAGLDLSAPETPKP